jgi:hypothetical protein
MPYVPPEVMQQTILQQQQRIRELEQENAQLRAALDGDYTQSYVDELQYFVDEFHNPESTISIPIIASIDEH